MKAPRFTVLACAVLVWATGCARDEDAAEVIYFTEREGASATVWIPVNEPRSVGTYRVEALWPDGRRGSIDGERDGMISDVWFADLDGDAAPELIVAMSSAGSGTYGSVDVYRYLPDGSLAAVRVNDLDDRQRTGYMGHDSFSVEGDRLYRSYPVYLDGDSNAVPTGGRALFYYSVSEGAWVALAVEEDESGGNAKPD